MNDPKAQRQQCNNQHSACVALLPPRVAGSSWNPVDGHVVICLLPRTAPLPRSCFACVTPMPTQSMRRSTFVRELVRLPVHCCGHVRFANPLRIRGAHASAVGFPGRCRRAARDAFSPAADCRRGPGRRLARVPPAVQRRTHRPGQKHGRGALLAPGRSRAAGGRAARHGQHAHRPEPRALSTPNRRGAGAAARAARRDRCGAGAARPA